MTGKYQLVYQLCRKCGNNRDNGVSKNGITTSEGTKNR